MTTNPTDQPSPLSPFDAYYRKPSPIGALDLAISDAKSHRDFEFSDQLCKLRDTYADSQRKIGELRGALEMTANVLEKAQRAIGVSPIELSDPEKRPLLLAIHQASTSACALLKSTE